MLMTLDEVLEQLQTLARSARKEGMALHGIEVSNAFGVSLSDLRKFAKEIGKNHLLAQQLWDSGYHEARILSGIIDEPTAVTEQQMDEWTHAFYSWDITDQTVNNLFRKTPYAWKKANQWCRNEKEFVKRAGFVMMAVLAVHDKNVDDQQFEMFFPCIIEEAYDSRNFVKKAVNWALRQIGKRNLNLNQKAVELARQMRQQEHVSAKWIASDALRELTSEKVLLRLQKKK